MLSLLGSRNKRLPGPNVPGPHYLVTDEQHDTLHRLLCAGLASIQ